MEVLVDLPGTSVLDGSRLRAAGIRTLTGHDELAVQERGEQLSAIALADVLLRSCVLSLHLEAGATPARGRLLELTMGDREALLLRLRELSFGSRLSLVATCPDVTCAETMDIELDIADVCCAPAASTAPTVTIDTVKFRLPTAADVHAVSTRAMDDPLEAGREIARRCILNVDEPDDTLLDKLGERFPELDPQAAVELSASCAACGGPFSTPLDAVELLRSEILARRADLLTGVHVLAFHYHWRERDILDLPVNRRRRYVEILTGALTTSAGWGLT